MGSDKNSGAADKSIDATITQIIEYKVESLRRAAYNIKVAQKRSENLEFWWAQRALIRLHGELVLSER